MSTIIEGIKLVKKTGIDPGKIPPVDPTEYPFQLHMNCSPPEFMAVTFIMLYGGSEEVIVRGKTFEALDEFAKINNLRTHPRLRFLEITKGTEIIERTEGSKV